jgi:hypothetical protein
MQAAVSAPSTTMTLLNTLRSGETRRSTAEVIPEGTSDALHDRPEQERVWFERTRTA